jgi:hypothetical protein
MLQRASHPLWSIGRIAPIKSHRAHRAHHVITRIGRQMLLHPAADAADPTQP